MTKEDQPLSGRKNRRRSTAYDPSRRRFLKYSAATIGLLATGISGYLLKDNFFSTDDKAIIFGEVDRLGIKKSQKEIDLWSHASMDLPQNIPVQGNEQRANSIFFDTLDRMLKSENEDFRNASSYLLNLAERNKLRFAKITKGNDTDTSLGIGLDMDSQGQLEFEFNVNLDFVLNKSTPAILAGSITHEYWHLKRFADYLNTLPPASGAVHKSKLESYFYDKQRMLIEESFVYGKEEEAYIRQAGLLGKLYGENISGQDDRAANFILFGKDSSSQRWKNYIQKILK